MTQNETDISKMYYTMGEVSAMLGVNSSLIRYYEKEFDTLQPRKNKKGNRYFTNDDIDSLKIILSLTREKGYTISGAKEYLKNNLNVSKDNQAIINSLENLKRFLLEVSDQLSAPTGNNE